jgi:hypothetical protein
MFTRLAVLISLLVLMAPAATQGPNQVERFASFPGELVKDMKTDAEIADALFKLAMRRDPTAKEKDTVTAHMAKAKNREDTCRDVLWAILNSREFAKVQGLTVAQAAELANKVAERWEKK